MFLALEPLLIERLSARVQDVKAVLSARDLAGITEGQQPTPAVHVVYDGYRVAQDTGNGGAKLRQRWLVIVCVRNVRQENAAAAAREDADRAIDSVISALLGWEAPGFGPLSLAEAPRPLLANGFGYFPVGFETALFVTGDPV